jgi:hypothetical protein
MANRRFIDFPIAASVGDNDIVLIWQDGLNKQTTKATLLQGSPQSLAGLTDVDIAGLTNGQILQYNSTLGKWENVDRTDINLSELGDVTIVAPTNGQVLVYNSSTSKWENSSGGYVPYTGAVTTVNLGAQSILAGTFVKAGGTSAQFLKADGSVDSTAYGTGSVTSVGLTMPSAFSVANSPVTTAGTLAVTGAGTVGQYIRGDGSLADFPATTGGGSSVSYYLNGSVSQGTIGGVAYREVNRTPIFGAGTDITTSSNGYIANFITDAGDPNKLEIPAGNWNLETYFSASSGGGSPTFYVELYKYDGTTFTLIATSSGTPELIAFGTNINPYFSTLAVPQTTLALTDRLALRFYVNTSGRTITLHTENNHLCQIITTFTTGLTALNGLTAQVQNFATGTTGTDFNIASATATHTFNLPTASATNRGALSSTDWTTFNSKIGGTLATGQVAFGTAANTIGGDNGLFWDNTNKRLGVGTNAPTTALDVKSYVKIDTYAAGTTLPNLAGYLRIESEAKTGWAPNDELGKIEFFGKDTSGIGPRNAASIRAINSQGNGTTTTTFNGELAFYTSDANALETEKVRITSTGNLLVNTINEGIYVTRSSENAFGSHVRARKARGTVAAPTIVLNGDTVANLTFEPYNGTAFSEATGIRGVVNGTVSVGVTPTDLVFSAGSNGTVVVNERWRITSAGILQSNGAQTIQTSTGLLSLQANGGNVGINTTTDAGFRLDVNGSTRFNGLSTIQGTAASDSGQLGAELLTTGTGDASWTGTSFATGYTHVVGSTTTLTSTLAGVVNTFYQITYTVTGRTAGSFTIAFGGFTSAALTATGAVGPQATTTGTLVITPTSDFNGTIVLSIRTISTSSASVTFNNNSGTVTNQIRISSINTNTFVGLNAGRTNTTGGSNAFFGVSAGQNNTTASQNSFFGASAGQNNTTGGSNAFFGTSAGQNNTTGVANAFFGTSAGQNVTTGGDNTIIGTQAGRNATTGIFNTYIGSVAGRDNGTGSRNVFIGRQSGTFIANGTTALTIANNSIFIGFDTRANADSQTNQIVIGDQVTGLGSNTTVLGNSSTTHGRWYGNLLIGTTTNAASSILTMESTTQGFLPPRMTTTQRNAIASPATGLVVYDTTLNDPFYYNGTAWTMFQDGITLTTTGTSGAATLVGTTLNIPQYQAALTNPVTGTGTSGQVAYFNGTSSITGESNLFWDSTNDRLGIATNSPLHRLQITQAVDGSYPTLGTGKGALFVAGDTNLYGLYLGINTTDGNSWFQAMRNNTATAYNIVLNPVGGNVGIGTTLPNSRLHVAGDFRTVLTSGVGGDTLIAAINGVSNGYIINVDTSNNITHTWNTGANAAALRITPGGNLLVGTTTDVGAKLYVNGGIRTANPTGSTSNDWLLGRALVSGSSTPDRWIRVQIGNLYYDILAVYMGSV